MKLPIFSGPLLFPFQEYELEFDSYQFSISVSNLGWSWLLNVEEVFTLAK